MACLEGQTYNPAGTGLEETRGGVLVYGGSASGLQEWRFKVLERMRGITASGGEEQASKLGGFLGQELRNAALLVAMDLFGRRAERRRRNRRAGRED